MFRFTIFGITVVVEPWFWITALLLGRGIDVLQSNNPQEYLWLLVWVVILFVSILVHELGHAIVGIKTSGGRTWIKLWAMGGLAYHEGSRFTKKTRAQTIIAGPAAGFCLFLLVAAYMLIRWPDGVGLELLWRTMIFNYSTISSPAHTVYYDNLALMEIFKSFVWINFWWSLVNLLPVNPLDGGQLLGCYMRSQKKLHKIGMITGAIVCVLALATGHLFAAVLFGYLAFQNYQASQSRF